MTTLTDLKAIAARRTPGEWESVACYVRGPNTMILANEQDASFIAMCANNIDKLIAVCEAAKEINDTKIVKIHNMDIFIEECAFERLEKVFFALESEC